ncbi:MAG: tetratricopeptide repeat protein, partial [Candidatus Neomarinimicrobiota bacterium]|nr:tetratricopeptide repeat protein [Candidatus Neomarinimicrobiota bacterium]
MKKEEKPRAGELFNVVEARNLGLAYLEENRLDEAEQEFLKVVKHAPEDAMGYANLGIVYMRKGEYNSAEENVQRAVEMVPEDPDVRLILAEVYEAAGKNHKAVEALQQSLESSQDHVRSLYRLAEAYSKMGYLAPDDVSIQNERTKYLLRLVNVEPASVPAKLQLIESLLMDQLTDSALAQMELLVQQIPEPPKEAISPMREALKAMQLGDNPKASRSFRIVHNVLKVTPRYQADLIQLKGPGGANAGFPILNFSENLSQRVEDESTVLKTLRFTDATSLSGLDVVNHAGSSATISVVAVADFDGDNVQDIYYSVWDGEENRIFLLRQEFGEFTDIASESGVKHSGADLDARFADIDNNGHLDLLVVNTAGARYYKNGG